ncbi:hypothetical protein M406DRAFT_102142 [Cryphonectria parasitica EP155]|uniref:Uncharacterized protein n=1 Tax=Cryphonectria parasitica (strain ATCC 38755 / EP155) TaxID=660469 RepID=A0A9P4Y7A9_CRYP1|nr:uncharacterized protein M406DRAFT_102142 [Cryphonectria parasitica EP155]KAF3767873.1 hypothetical protein M406DRAFT_102142 [Cryphonectria parasitica EP155]
MNLLGWVYFFFSFVGDILRPPLANGTISSKAANSEEIEREERGYFGFFRHTERTLGRQRRQGLLPAVQTDSNDFPFLSERIF